MIMEIDGYLSTGGLVRFLPTASGVHDNPEIDAANNPHNGHKKRPEETNLIISSPE